VDAAAARQDPPDAPTTVRPTTRGESPAAIATLEAPRTSISAPSASTTSPTTRSRIVIGDEYGPVSAWTKAT
jgi:hypothetical protein